MRGSYETEAESASRTAPIVAVAGRPTGATENAPAAQRSKGGFLTKAAAQRHLTRSPRPRRRRPTSHLRGQRSGSTSSSSWLPAQRQRLRVSTFDDYSMRIRRHIVPALGHFPSKSSRRSQIDRFYADLLEHGSARGGGMAPKSVRNVHIIIRKALADATRSASSPRTSRSTPTLRGSPPWRVGADDVDTRGAADVPRRDPGAPLAPAFLAVRGRRACAAARSSASAGRTSTSTAARCPYEGPSSTSATRSLPESRRPPADGGRSRSTPHRRRPPCPSRQPSRGVSNSAWALRTENSCSQAGRTPTHPDLFSKTFDRTVKRLGLRQGATT